MTVYTQGPLNCGRKQLNNDISMINVVGLTLSQKATATVLVEISSGK